MARQLDLEKRNAILAAAFSAFGESGYHNTTIKDIADVAGIAPGSVYTYFEDKEDLFRTTVYGGLHTFQEEIKKILVLPDPFDLKFDLIIEFGFDLFKKVHPIFQGMFAEPNRLSLFKENIEGLCDIFEEIFLAGQQMGAIELFEENSLSKSAIRIFISGILFHTAMIPRDDLDEEIELLKEQTKKGLAETLRIGSSE